MASEQVAALMSIRQRFVNLILDGKKTVELRRIQMRRDVSHVFIYESKGSGMVVGYFEVERLVSKSPRQLWRQYQSSTGLSKYEFDEYFAGCSLGVAIEIRKAKRFNRPLPLCDLDVHWPPQSFSYVAYAKREVFLQSQGVECIAISSSRKPEPNAANRDRKSQAMFREGGL